MKKGVIVLLILTMSLLILAGDKMEILEALKLKKITETLSLDKKQIAEYMIMEEELRELNRDMDIETEELLNEARMSLKKGQYNKVENIIESFRGIEEKRVNRSLEIRKGFMNTLNDEQKLRYFIFEHEFRKKLRENILMNKLHKEDK